MLAFVLLIGFALLAQAQPSQAPILKTPDNENITNDNMPYFSWENIVGENITKFWLVIDETENFTNAENFYDNRDLIDNFDNFHTHPENALPEGVWY